MPLRKPPRKLFDLSLEAFAFHVVSNIENLCVGRNSSSETPGLSKLSLSDESKNGCSESKASSTFEDKISFDFHIVSNMENIAIENIEVFSPNASSETPCISRLSLRDESKNGCSESEASLTFEDQISHLMLLPSTLYDEILSKILQLLGGMPTSNNITVFLSLGKLLTLFMTENLQHLDLTPLICFFGFYNVYKRPLDIFGLAKNLVSFTLKDMCNDSILHSISINCSHLKYVNIANSKLVTDSGVSALAPSSESSGCRKLRALIIYGCEVSVPVVSTLLKSLLDIEYIGYSKMHDVLLDFIKQKDGNEVNSTRTLKLTQLTVYDVLSLPDFGNLCPNLQYLDIRMSGKDSNSSITCLKDFPHISQLFLINESTDSRFPSPSTCEYFSTTNLSLTSLTINYKTFELAYLLLLGKQCPNLTELHVSSVSLLCDKNLKIEDGEASYKNLSVFIFELHDNANQYSDLLLAIFCAVLKNTKVLRRLSLIGRDILTDESLRYLLSHINTDSLVDLNIDYKAVTEGFGPNVMWTFYQNNVPLTMSSVHYALDKCSCLKSLGSLFSWYVHIFDIEQLQQDLIASNYDIQLSGWLEKYSLKKVMDNYPNFYY